MSERVGALRLGQADGEVFLGRDMGHQREYSEDIAGLIDDEVRRLIESAHDEAWEILTHYRQVLDDLAFALLERETLNQAELAEVFAPIAKRPPRPVWLSSAHRTVSELPPVRSPKEIAAGSTAVYPQDEAAAAGSPTSGIQPDSAANSQGQITAPPQDQPEPPAGTTRNSPANDA